MSENMPFWIVPSPMASVIRPLVFVVTAWVST